jgi:hypothetical protein
MGHWAIVVGQMVAGRRENLPTDTPSVAPQLRLSACELDAGTVPKGHGSVRVGGVNWHRQRIEDRSPFGVGRKSTERGVENMFRIRPSLHVPRKSVLAQVSR